MAKTIQKFNEIEMKELEAKGCTFVTPLSGSKGELFFKIDKKKGIGLDKYIFRNEKLINIISEEGLKFDQLIEKL